MPGDQIDWHWVRLAAALAAKPLKDVFERHVALAPDQQAHGVANRTAAAMQLNHALRPRGQLVRGRKRGGCIQLVLETFSWPMYPPGPMDDKLMPAAPEG
jgi:hypothetical protein